MKPQVFQVGVGLELDNFKADVKSQKIKQISLNTRPIFSDKSKHIFVAAGCDINIYNTNGGNLQNVLKMHESNIISICKLKSQTEDQIISCDEELNIFHWKIGPNDCEKLLSLRKPNLGTNYKAIYFGIGINSSFLVNFEDAKSGSTYLFHYCSPYKGAPMQIARDIIKGANTIATSSDGNYIAALTKSVGLYINKHPFTNRESKRLHKSSKRLCCLAFHPIDGIVAVGDITGAITLWYDIMKTFPIKMKIHWHTLPVQDLSFSSDGNELYSGGAECVIVRWQLKENNRKSFLPRLGTPIRYISTDEVNSFVGALHEDKAISIINSREMVLEGLIQSLSLHLASNRECPLPVKLLHDPIRKSLIMNGKTGHLQFFNPVSSTVLYNLDIAMSNFVSSERGGKLPNTEVTLATISDDGTWLVTTETCQLTKNMNEIYLKFWYFSSEEQRWELNTSIQMPHYDNITSISLASATNITETRMCVTGSEDGKFKLWKLLQYLDVEGKERCHWNSRAVQEFRSLPVTCAIFSPDNSLVAVTFDSVITLWTPDSKCSLVGTLSQPFLSERIRDISFSYGEREGSLLMSRSDNWLCCWDLLSCSLKWRVSIQTTCLAVERITGIMVVFTKSKEIMFFDPHSNKPIMQIESLSSSEVLGATFVSSVDKFCADLEVPWGSNSSLYFLDKEQILFTVRNRDDLDGPLSKSIKRYLNQLTSDHHREVDRTLYSALVARSRNITRPQMELDIVTTDTTKVTCSLIERLNRVDIHNMESIVSLMGFLYQLPPDLKTDKFDARKNESLKYNVVKEMATEERGLDYEESNPMELSRMINIVENMNYENIVSILNS